MNRPRPFGRLARNATFLVVAVAAAGCTKPPERQGRPPVSVAVTTVKRQSLPFTIEANGTVMPMSTANVAAQVDGIMQDVLFREGQEVSKGQTLFKIDPRPYQNALAQARGSLARDLATYEMAKDVFDRWSKLYATKVVTQDDYESKKAAFLTAQSVIVSDSGALATAQFNLDNTTIKAPISGRTGGLLVRPGNLVRAAGGGSLVVINQVRPILVRFPVPGSQLPMILHYGGKGGLPVTVTPTSSAAPPTPPPGSASTPMDAAAGSSQRTTVALNAPPTDPPEMGKLFFIDNAVDTTTATIQLKAEFDNRSGQLWAGQFVATSLRLFVEDSALTVPAQCVVTGQRGTYVYVVDSANTAQQRPVTIERTTNGVAIIATGLAAGERVVTDGQSRLSDGATVDLSGGRGGGGRGGRGGRGRGGKSDATTAGGAAGGKASDAAPSGTDGANGAAKGGDDQGGGKRGGATGGKRGGGRGRVGGQ